MDLRRRLEHCRLRTFETSRTTHVIAERGFVSAQIAVSRMPGKCVGLYLDIFADPPAQTRLLARLLALADADTVPRTARRPTRSDRLPLILRALDAATAGASQREIASVLFGAGRAARDWRDPRGHLRDVTRRLLRRGRYMAEHGYLRLLV